jgi:Ser/Thr protein kinase RdoA (MazF antagonist)
LSIAAAIGRTRSGPDTLCATGASRRCCAKGPHTDVGRALSLLVLTPTATALWFAASRGGTSNLARRTPDAPPRCDAYAMAPGDGGDGGTRALAEFVRVHFGFDGELVPLPGELDRNFALGGYVLKLHAPGTDPGSLDLQDAAMEHVAARAPAVATPRLVRARDGSPRIALDGGGFARVLTWVPGTPWGRAEAAHGAEALRSLGRAVAGLDAALNGFEHPRLDRPLRWNMLGAADLRGAAAAADPVLERFAERIHPALAALPAQAIHNDANEHNVMIGADGRVTGLIDFGDLCRAPRSCGLAVACAYAMTTLAVPEREVLPLVAGYHEVVPLAPEELALLPDLIRTRLAMSVALAAIQRAEQPDNEYLLISQRGVTALLARLGTVPPELDVLRLRAACGYEAR